MTRIKELADALRDCAAMTVQPSSISRKEALELAAICDRLHAIESATPDEVGQIERLHSAKLTRLLIEAGPVIAKEADRDRATMLAIVRRQAVELEDKADGLADYDARVQELRRDLGTLSGVSVFRHAKQIVAERLAARAEVERLKTANAKLAAENARLVNEVGDADQKLAQIRERVRRWEDQEDGATDNMEDIARIVRDLL